MKKLIILCALPIFFGFKSDREIDEKKMNRDLEISKNILATLIKSGSDSFFGGESIEASYIKDYGVVFTIPEHLIYFHSNSTGFIAIPDMPPIPDLDVDVEYYGDFDLSEDLSEEQKDEMRKQRVIIKENQKEIKKHQKEFEKNTEEFEKAQEEMSRARKENVIEIRKGDGVYRINGAPDEGSEVDWEGIMVTFMTDYADLIGQLEPEERIIIKQKSPYNQHVLMWTGKETGEQEDEQARGNISAMVLRKDVATYKSGKINKDTFISRIDITKTEPQKKIADLEMFANIFDRYYSSDLTETFYCQGVPSYELLEGFGVIFHVKAASPGSAYRVKFGTSGGNWNATSGDQDTDAEKLYTKFKKDLKAFMLDYGRTIRSLKDDDMISLKIKLSSCHNCKIPSSMEVSTKMSVLKQYDQQKLARDKALDKIDIKEII